MIAKNSFKINYFGPWIIRDDMSYEEKISTIVSYMNDIWSMIWISQDYFWKNMENPQNKEKVLDFFSIVGYNSNNIINYT